VRRVSRLLAYLYRLCAAIPLGAQLFFAAVAAQAAFPREVAALPQGHPARTAAAELVGRMLAPLDRLTLVLAAIAVVIALVRARSGAARSRRAAIPPLLAGVFAGVSMGLITPAIHAMRMAGQTGTSQFGLLHAASSLLLLAEMAALAVALWFARD
jgi:hypothetical protein